MVGVEKKSEKKIELKNSLNNWKKLLMDLF